MITLFSAGGESTASLIGSAAWILATHPDVQRQVREQPALLGAFLRRGAALRAAFPRPLPPCSPRHRTVRRRNCRPVRACSCCGVRPIATHRTSTTPVSSGSIGHRPRVTSPSARASTSASERRSPGWKPTSCSVNSSNARHSSRPPRPGGGCPAFWCAGSTIWN